MAGTFTNLLYHVIFSTKDRQGLILPEFRHDLHDYIGGILRNTGGILLAIGGVPDHIHLVLKLGADASVAETLRIIKANSSKWANKRSAKSSRFEWQRGYGAFTVSESQLPAVVDYVQRQEEHHRSRSFQEEFTAFLERHGISFDPKYIWD